MGATESIFYDEEEEDEVEDEFRPPPQRKPSSAAGAAARRSSAPGAVVPAGAARGGTVRPRPPPSPSQKSMAPPQTTQRRRVIQQAAPPPPSQDHQEAVPARARPSAVAVQPNPPLELSGMLLGMSATGKHTLMQRLEGKEPEFSTGGSGTRRARQRHQRNNSAVSNTTSESPSAASDSRQQRIVTAPYQTPPNVPKWDDRIQLRVQAGRKVISKHHPVDFYVLLVDPRHDRQKFEKYLSKTVTTALRAQGYGKRTSTTEHQQQHPFCLCLLRNFRDLLPEEENENENDNGVATIIGESDLTTWTLQILQDYAPDLTDPVLQCCNTSLLNCYGLGLLHHFIYQAYVQRKRFDLKQQLRQIQQAQTQALRGAPAALSYADYCAQVEQLVQNNGSSSARRRSTTNDDETSTTSATSSRRKNVGGVLPSASASSTARGRANSGESSSTLPSSAQPSLVHDAKDALEAFLESDSDDSAPPKDEEDDDNNSSNSSDKNDEEDFFYDDSGVRFEAGKGRVDDASNGNEEPTPTTQQAEAQTEDEKKPHQKASSDPSKADSVNENDLEHSCESPKSFRKQTDASQDDTSSRNAGEEESDHDASDHPVADDDGIKSNEETDSPAAIPVQDHANEKVDTAYEVSPNESKPNVSIPADDDEESESEFFVDKTVGDCDTEEALKDGNENSNATKAAEIGNYKKRDLELVSHQSADPDEPDSMPTALVDDHMSNATSSMPDTITNNQFTKNRRKPVADEDVESESEFFIDETGDEGAIEDAPRNISSPDAANSKAGKSPVDQETESGDEAESKPEEKAEAAAAPDSKVAEDATTVDESNRARQEKSSPQEERHPVPTATSAPATDSAGQISAEARAAILAAQQDMERLMLEQQQQKSDKPKKAKKSRDGEKKKKSKEKRSKKEKVEGE